MSDSPSGSSLSERLATYFTTLQPDEIPGAVRDDARWRLMDTIGVALAGSRMDYAESVRTVFAEMGGKPEATAIGFGPKMPAGMAGFVNGAYAHGPDYDDTHSVAMVHIGCLAVPSALAMAERCGSTGGEMLTALIAGAEVGLRIGAAAPHRFHMRGFHATGVVGPFTSAVAAGRLLRLDARQLTDAMGLVGSQAAGLLVGLHDGSWVKRLHPGWSVQAGITAALLAQRGFLGPHEVLENPWGLYGVLLHGDERPAKLKLVTKGLGETWLMPATTYKPYSSGAWNHSTMDAVRTIMRSSGVVHQEISRVDVAVPEECIPIVCEPRAAKTHPATAYHMKFSLPYSTAILAVLGHANIEDYTEEVRANPAIAELASRIFCVGDPAMAPDGFPARVALETTDGRRYEEFVPAQRGGPGNPMSAQDHREKFRANAAPSLGEGRAQEASAAIEAAWELDRVGELTRLLVAN